MGFIIVILLFVVVGIIVTAVQSNKVKVNWRNKITYIIHLTAHHHYFSLLELIDQ